MGGNEIKLITITGPSGAGKDTFARMLSEATGIPILCSYTTRPKREGEVYGREHYFVRECNAVPFEMLAYTRYGGYEYWTRIDQIGDKAIYVIDEDGLRNLCSNYPEIEICSVYITASLEDRLSRGISESRIARDAARMKLPLSFYQYHIYNVNDKDDLQRMASDLADLLKTKIV